MDYEHLKNAVTIFYESASNLITFQRMACSLVEVLEWQERIRGLTEVTNQSNPNNCVVNLKSI